MKHTDPSNPCTTPWWKLLPLLLLLLFAGGVDAQVTVTIGSGTLESSTTQNGNPIYRSSIASSYGWAKSIQLWTATDLAGMSSGSSITAIAFDKTTASTIAAGRTATMSIYLKNSNATALASGTSWNDMTSAATLVYSNTAVGPSDVPAVAGYWTISLGTPFTYLGGAIEVYITWDVNGASSGLSTGAFQWRYATTTAIQAMGTSGTAAIPGTTSTWTTLLWRFNAQVTFTPGAPCNATPAPGNTTGPASICSGVNFTLGVQNNTTGSGVTYQWQSSTDGSTWANASGASTSTTYTTTQAASTWYRCQVTCAGNGTGTSTPLQVALSSFLNCYCTPAITSSIEPICNVTFAGINNTTSSTVGGTPAVENFTSITANVSAGATYPISCTGNSDGSYTNYFTAFFDWNRDGIFETAVPIGSFTGSVCTAVVTGSITVPPTALAGTSRMRIIKNYSTSPTDPCGSYGYGQVEDYTVNVAAAATCNSTPAPGNTTGPATICAATSFTLGIQNTPTDAGITYQWQTSTDGSTWANASGASTGATYTTMQAASTWYR
ncbi:MAG: hypothetical protein JST38_00415, partial [Bacteroidetes bacterium]|nr:hypothetical protein [Bacteroidota bacterium]